MLDILKGKILGKTISRKNTGVESPAESPPAYVDDNPMFPTKPSVHQSNDTMGFVLGTDFPKVVKSPKKKGKDAQKVEAETVRS